MEWLLEGLLEIEGDMRLLWDHLAQVLACTHCGSSCLLSPGNLGILLLFVIWQIRRWRQLGKWPQLQSWFYGDMTQSKGLPFLYHVAFLDCLWKQKLEQEEEEEEEEKEEDASLDTLKPYFPLREIPVGKQTIRVTSLPCDAPVPALCGPMGFSEASGTPEQTLKQPLSPSRSFPIFQIVTNLPVRHTAAGSFLQQRKSQLFWGLPSLHSESLEVTFQSSGGPSMCFNKLTFLLKPNLLFPQDCPATQFPTYYSQSLEELAPDLQPLSPPVLSLAPPIKPFPSDHKRVLPSTEAQTQMLTQGVPWVPKDQALRPLLELRSTSPSKLLPLSVTWLVVPWDPSFQQRIPDLHPASLIYPFSLLGVLTRSEVPWTTTGQNEDLKASKPATSSLGSSSASLPQAQEVNPDLAGSEVLCETTQERELSKLPTSTPCLAPKIESQRTSIWGVPPGCENEWKTVKQKESFQVSEPLMSASGQFSDSLSKLQKVFSEGGLSSPEGFWGATGQRENHQASAFPIPLLCRPQPPCPNSTPRDLSRYTAQSGHRANSGSPRAFENTELDVNQSPGPLLGMCGTSLACVPTRSEVPGKDRQRRENLWVSANPVSPSRISSNSVLEPTGVDPQGVLSESKALQERENLWASETPAPTCSPPLDPIQESYGIYAAEGLLGSATTLKGTEPSGKFWAAKSTRLVLSRPLAPTQDSFRVRPMRVPLDSEAVCGDIQNPKNSRAPEAPACCLPEEPQGESSQRISSDSGLMREVMKQGGNYCAPVPIVKTCSLPSNSASKSLMIEPIEDPRDEEVVEPSEKSWVPELPASARCSLSASPLERQVDSEIVWRNMQQRDTHHGSNPPAVETLPLECRPPTLAEIPKMKHKQPDLLKEEILPEVETPSSQEEAVPNITTPHGLQAWHWSGDLEGKLKNLQQKSAFRFPRPSQSLGSSPTTSSTTSGFWEFSSCLPQETRPPSARTCSSKCCVQQVQCTRPQPTQVSHCCQPHPSSQMQSQGPDRVNHWSLREDCVKILALVPSQESPKFGDNCPGLGKNSNPKILPLDKRQNEASMLCSDKKREHLKKPQSDYEEDTGLRPLRFTAKVPYAQAQRQAQVPINRFFEGSCQRDQHSLHSALRQQLPNTKGPQNKCGTKMGAGDMPNPLLLKKCVSSPTLRAPTVNGFQRMLAKLLGTPGPQSNKSNGEHTGSADPQCLKT